MVELNGPMALITKDGVLRLLDILHDEGDLNVGELRQAFGGGMSGLYSRLDLMLNHGVVEDERLGYRNIRVFRLTEKGRSVRLAYHDLLDEVGQ